MISLLMLLINMITDNPSEVMFCDIKGNVENPGVYEVINGEVINDIVIKAGGLKKNSYIRNINLSKKVNDEMVIYIMTIDEYEDYSKTCPPCECEIKRCEDNSIGTTSTSKTPLITTSTGKTTLITSTTLTTTINTINNLININNASLEELIKLPGIGVSIATKIINYREENRFTIIEDIKNVSGIGDKLFEKIKNYITI